MRKTFGKVIVELAEKDDSIVLLVGDYGYGIVDEFKKRFPDRYFNLGICEQSMIGIAAGMALSGLKPYVYTITAFLIERPFEQVKLDIDQQNVNVKLIGYGDFPEQGITHNTLDDRKLSELFKNIKSYFPENGHETKMALVASYLDETPTFISLKKESSEKGQIENEVSI